MSSPVSAFDALRMLAPLTHKIGATLALALICGSCTRGILVEPSGFGTAVQLEFYQPGAFWRGSLGDNNYPTDACVSEITVGEVVGPHGKAGQVIWHISTPSDCLRLRQVEIGKTPAGFVETVDRLPLHIGEKYRATARTGGGLVASKSWLVCSAAPAVRRWEDDYWLVNESPRCSP